MPTFPEPPLIHRSAYTRGFFAPAHWVMAGLALLYDTPVTFRRHVLVDIGGGNFEPTTGPQPPVLWSTVAHVELETEGGVLLQTDGIGPLNRRRYVIICEAPVDTAAIPKRDDTVEFTDATGRAIRLKIDKADIALNLPGHIEIETETFE